MTISMTKILPFVAIILSIGAIASVGISMNQSTDLTDVEKRLDEQQNVIMVNRGMIINNTIFDENQFNFNNDLILWAGNVSDRIDILASNHQ